MNGNYGVSYNWTKEKLDNIIKKYEEGYSAAEIAIDYGCNHSTILYLLNNNGIDTSRRREFHNFKKYSVNENYFDIIDNECKAYWMGFLLADGHVTKDGKIMLTLQTRDYSHIEKFRDSLSSSHPIKKVSGQDAYEVVIGSSNMGESLYKKGFHNRKSWGFDVERVVSSIPVRLNNHFIRGYFDGDGSVGIYNQTHYPDKKSFNFSIVGIKPFLEYISETTGIYSQIKIDDRTDSTYSLVTRSKDNVIKYGEFLYKDASIFMNRKHEIFLKIKKM